MLILKITLCICLIGAAIFLCVAIFNCQKADAYKELNLKEKVDKPATPY